MKTKQVIIIRKDLNMRRGKEITQGAHASLKVFFDMMTQEYGLFTVKNGDSHKYVIRLPKGELGEEMRDWIKGEYTKVTVRVESEKELLELVKRAEKAGIPCSLVKDKGHTEFDGKETLTAGAIGPCSSERIDKITSHLQLY